MNTQTHQDYPGLPTLVQAQARRRQLLGLLLLAVGSVWFYLRVTGQVGEMPWPVCWAQGPAAVLDRFSIGCDASAVPEAAYGMLAAHIRYRQQSHAE